jgi:hypothetical protein
MPSSKKLSIEEQVAAYLQQLNHPLKGVVEALRIIILATDREVGEQIKWNSLSFYYTGEMKPFDPKEYRRDILVINLNKKDFVLLVFPTGATINDTTGLLEGKYPDGRKMAKFSTLDDVQNKKNDLQFVIRQWLSLVDK